ncbi:MATE efflux family protein [Gottschalkia purinilytica]|uniref:Probable multidrug resistance protein NorM n=1 Tax=Gottschalkia purinilytica TaxID=1503 RepID=A0A0L0WF14_GOTPU|nr:MATE family efflux transporter [Gottschalkia purinilytica]KNF10073.1 MATE efflux family protein [Gottschalkia purinilytica]
MLKSLVNFTFNDREFYKTLSKLALPIFVQNLITSSLNMVDTIMVGRLGELELASVGIVNQIFFLFNFIIVGITAGCGVFIAQYSGIKDTKNIKKVLGISLSMVVINAAIFMIAGLIFPENVMGLFSKETEVVLLGKEYFQVVCISYIFTAITFSFANASKSIGNTAVPMVTSFIAVTTNIILNYILIFGKLGFPAMGVKGAAMATVIARILETTILLTYIYSKKGILAAKLNELFSFNKAFLLKVLKTVSDTVLIEITWALGVVVYAAIYARMGYKAIAAVNIHTTVQSFFLIAVYGISNSAVVMVGNEIGAGNEEKAKTYARRFAVLAVILGLFLSALMAFSAKYVVTFFNISEGLRSDAIKVLYAAAILFVSFVFDTIIMVGALRGGGDTKVPLIAETFTMWCLGVPLAYIGAFVLKLPIYGVIFFVNIEEFLKSIFVLYRLLSNKWMKKVIENA